MASSISKKLAAPIYAPLVCRQNSLKLIQVYFKKLVFKEVLHN